MKWDRIVEIYPIKGFYPPTEAYRTPVPGGWLVAVHVVESGSTVVFVPDPDHAWEVELYETGVYGG